MKEELRVFPGESAPLWVSLAGITHPDPHYHIERPAAGLTVLEYVTAGEGVVQINGQERPVRAGEVYLLCAGTSQIYRAAPSEPFEKVFLNMEGVWAERLPADCGLLAQGIYSGEGLWDLFAQIPDLVRHKPQADDGVTLAALFTQVLLRLSRRMSATTICAEAVAMKDWIDRHPERLVHISELAACLFRSSDYCIKRFAAAYGVTPYEYQLSMKMDIACRLLKGSRLPVQEIAAAVGYSDPQYFSGLFRRRVGVPPRTYRNQNAEL